LARIVSPASTIRAEKREETTTIIIREPRVLETTKERVAMNPDGKGIKYLLLLLISVLIISCKGWGEYYPGYRHLTTFDSQDTASQYKIEIFARIPDSFDEENLPLILTIERPGGSLYNDTITLPVRMDMIPYTGVKTGRWRDMKWGYRTGVVLAERGKWKFYINNNLSVTKKGCSGAMGVIISKL
jgi:hypothetical protein